MTLNECIENLVKEIRCQDRHSYGCNVNIENCHKCVYFVDDDTFDESLRCVVEYVKTLRGDKE